MRSWASKRSLPNHPSVHEPSTQHVPPSQAAPWLGGQGESDNVNLRDGTGATKQRARAPLAAEQEALIFFLYIAVDEFNAFHLSLLLPMFVAIFFPSRSTDHSAQEQIAVIAACMQVHFGACGSNFS